MRQEEGKILGIIGGMGPMATQEFYKMIIEKTAAQKDQEHVNSIILNHATLPDRTEAISMGSTEDLTERIKEDAKFLEKAGACCIAVPCNTSHVVLTQVQKEINIPIINMIERTAKRIDELKGKQKVGILATDGTVKIKLYQKALEKYGIEYYEVTEESQKKVMKIIYEGVKAGKEIDFNEFLEVEKELKKEGCTIAVLACTELSYFRVKNNLSEFYLDAMAVLAEEAILTCGGQLK